MDFDVQTAIEQGIALVKKFFGAVLITMGITGGFVRMKMDNDIAHSKGQKFLVVFVGGIFAYMTGGLARKADLGHEWMSLIGFFSGFTGYSIMKYVIENEKAIFHNASLYIAKFFDIILEETQGWFREFGLNAKNKKKLKKSKS